MGASLQTTYSQTPAVAFIGQLDGNQNADKTTGRNNGATAMPFGTPVVRDASGDPTIDVKYPSASTDSLKGIVFRTDSYMPSFTDRNGTHGELGASGLVQGTIMDIARSGRMYVKNHTDVAAGDPLFVSYAVGVTYDAAGQLGNVAEAAKTIDCTGRGSWDSTATAGSGAWLNFNFKVAG